MVFNHLGSYVKKQVCNIQYVSHKNVRTIDVLASILNILPTSKFLKLEMSSRFQDPICTESFWLSMIVSKYVDQMTDLLKLNIWLKNLVSDDQICWHSWGWGNSKKIWKLLAISLKLFALRSEYTFLCVTTCQKTRDNVMLF